MVVLLLSALLATQQYFVGQQISPQWVFVKDQLVWKSPPDAIARYEYAENADIAVFSPSGEFALISCVLYRDVRTGLISIVTNEGYILRKGTWHHQTPDAIAVTSRIEYMSSKVNEISVPTSTVEQAWTLYGKAKGRIARALRPRVNTKKELESPLFSPIGTYIPLKKLSNTESLSKLLTFPISK